MAARAIDFAANPLGETLAFGVKHGIHQGVKRLAPTRYDAAKAWAHRNGFEACFAVGTLLRTPDGSRPIEEFQPGDLVLSRDESNADGLIVAQTVQEVFVRQGLVWHLHIGGQVIRTTAEHPFYAWGKGWVACHELVVGDTLLGEDGRWLTVEDLLDTGVWETVYNLRVADFHTYFVGCDEWGFSVWAHNTTCASEADLAELQHGFQSRVSEKFPFGEHLPAAEKGYPGIGRTAEGGPDFAGTEYLYAIKEGQSNIVQVKLTGSRTGDFDLANAAAGFDRTPTRYSWHHVDDYDPISGMSTLQLVQRDAHEATYIHYGSVSQYEAYHGVKYKS